MMLIIKAASPGEAEWHCRDHVPSLKNAVFHGPLGCRTLEQKVTFDLLAQDPSVLADVVAWYGDAPDIGPYPTGTLLWYRQLDKKEKDNA